MRCTFVDPTIESILADPMIAALRRADRVDARAFERLLRAAAVSGRKPPARNEACEIPR